MPRRADGARIGTDRTRKKGMMEEEYDDGEIRAAARVPWIRSDAQAQAQARQSLAVVPSTIAPIAVPGDVI